jgi:hypothetical protein
MTYPTITDYQDILQDPARAFRDPALQIAKVATSPMGLPAPMSGGLAITYQLSTGSKKYAVRCFHRDVPGVADRYARISSVLGAAASDYFVGFDFQADGILVNGGRHPIVKMDWVEGETLGVYLGRVGGESSAVKDLRKKFADLEAWLRARSIAHGDIQNDNVIVQGGGIKLIDYDGMHVPGMPSGSGTEVGQKNFQHPNRRTTDFGPTIDRFSFLVLDLSLHALAVKPALHQKYRVGGDAILFKANDFADPSSSKIFNELRALPDLREATERLADICSSPVSAVPTLPDFLAGRNIPAPRTRAPTPASAAPAAYIGAYPVLDGSNYGAVLSKVGDKVEIVGRLVSVYEGIGRRGRGRGKPYVFLNFGLWNQQSVKVTIWSEGLDALSTLPDESWIGRWISVTGLVEPPYEGSSRYGRSYESVGITVTAESQLVQLTESEGQYRLGSSKAPGTSRSAKAVSNAELVKTIGDQKTPPRPRSPGPTATPSRPPMSSNAALIASLQASSSTPSQNSNRSSPPASQSSGGNWGCTPVLIVAVFLSLSAFLIRH